MQIIEMSIKSLKKSNPHIRTSVFYSEDKNHDWEGMLQSKVATTVKTKMKNRYKKFKATMI